MDDLCWFFERDCWVARKPKDRSEWESPIVLKANGSVEADVTSLHFIHEPGILHNLRERIASNLPYTFMASALIGVNPLKAIAGPKISDYKDQNVGTKDPHPYAIAESSYQYLEFSASNQSIVVSGESGAGKTETAKIILKYLVNRDSASSPGKNVESLDVKLIKSSPILESFGNARTVRNNNSSRFGKFLKLCYKESVIATTKKSNQHIMELSYAMVETYLLEKSRVIHHGEHECNYHIFYQLLQSAESFPELSLSAYATANEYSTFSLLSPRSIELFNSIAEASTLDEVKIALQTIGFGAAQILGIWRILAGILHVGNVQFEDMDTSEGTVARIASKGKSQLALANAAKVLDVDPELLLRVLTQREMVAHGEQYSVKLTSREAAFTRDAVIKSVYENLFHYIVQQINSSLNYTTTASADNGGAGNSSSSSKGGMSPPPPPPAPPGGKPMTPPPAPPATAAAAAVPAKPPKNLSIQPASPPKPLKESSIGILDIFGFENFARNDFEQLLINYANEALQNTFNHQIFQKEVELFRDENIDFRMTECPDNRPCVELIAGKSPSILTILDSISRQPKPSDERFCEELHKAFSKNVRYFPVVHRKDMRQQFCIQHFAGTVRYTVDSETAAPGTVATGAIERPKSVASPPTGGGGDSGSVQGSSSWIAKNNDSVPDALQELYLSSKLSEFRALGKIATAGDNERDLLTKKAGATAGKAPEPKRRTSIMMKPTIATLFSRSMDELNSVLTSTQCHFIRCIKPNQQMTAELFEDNYVLMQLRALGIPQACEILQVGLPTRINYKDFKTALQDVVSKVQHLFKDESEPMLIACLLLAFDISSDMYRLGRTKIFFRAGQLAQLESILRRDTKAMSAEEERAITARIQESLDKSRLAMSQVTVVQKQMDSYMESFGALDGQFERMQIRFKELPNAHEELEIPPAVKQNKLRVEELMGLFKKFQNEEVDALKRLESVLKTRESPVYEKHRALSKSYGDEYQSTVVKTHAVITKQLLEAEIQAGKGLSALCQSTMNRNNELYEKAQDLITKCSDHVEAANCHAERCESLAVHDQITAFKTSFQELALLTKELKKAMEVVDAELNGYEASINSLNLNDIAASQATLQTVIDKFLSQSTQLVAAIQQDITAAEKPAAAPPPPPAPAAPSPAETAVRKSPPPPPPIKAAAPSPTLAAEPLSPPAIGKSASSDGPITPPAAAAGAPAPPPIMPLKAATPPPPPPPPPGRRSSLAAPPPPPTANPPPPVPARRSTLDAGMLAHAAEAATKPGGQPSDDGRTGGATGRRSSVKYSIGDLAAMRRLKAAEDGGGASCTSAVSAAEETKSEGTATEESKASADNSALAGIKEKVLPPMPAQAAPPIPGSAPPPVPAAAPAVAADPNALPPGWRQLLDKKTNRHYYVNDTTKEKSWYRPKMPPPVPGSVPPPVPAQAPPPVPSQQASQLPFALPPMPSTAPPPVPVDQGSDELPPGWRAVLDKKSNRTFYFNEVTKEKQWRRPIGVPTSPEAVRKVDRVSRRIRSQELNNKFQDPDEAENAGSSGGSDNRATKVAKARRTSATMLTAPSVAELTKDYYSRHSVAFMCRVGTEDKNGFLMKQSKFLGRWKKRYVVLSGDKLSYFDRVQDGVKGVDGKDFLLTGKSLTSFTSTEFCFCVSEGDHANEKSSWYLLASNESELESWMTAINAHIHVKYVKENGITTDYWDEGTVETTFWRVPPTTGRRPVGIRSLPIMDGPRTGEGVYPGEIIEVAQSITDSGNGQRFLRLANDRGWVFENHPSGNYAILTQVPGRLVERCSMYRYSSDFLEDLLIYSTPQCDPDLATGESFEPGRDDILGCMEWTCLLDATQQELEETGASSMYEHTFIKLADGRGWIPKEHPITGGELLQEISVKKTRMVDI